MLGREDNSEHVVDHAAGYLCVPLAVVGVFLLVTFIPSIAVQIRRFHDQDRSGFFVLLNFIPFIEGILVLVFMCLQGTKGENRFGPDPLAVTL